MQITVFGANVLIMKSTIEFKRLFVFAFGFFAVAAQAAGGDALILSIQQAHFEPQTLEIPAGVRAKVVVRNQDAMPAEFESTDLSREVIVPAHGEVTVFLGPVDPGTYKYFNDFNHSMTGTVVAKPATGGH